MKDNGLRQITCGLCSRTFELSETTCGNTTVMSGQYTLAAPAVTGAGVYKSDGKTLVRTLWSLKPQQAGTYTAYWDGKDDDGVDIMGLDTYSVKWVRSNATYKFGRIGNSSTALSGATVHTVLRAYQTMTILNNEAFLGIGFKEGGESLIRWDLTNPQAKERIGFNASKPETGIGIDYSCNDGTRAYFGGTASTNSSHSFAFGMIMATRAEMTGYSGTGVSSEEVLYGRVYDSAINAKNFDSTNKITGMAVGANYLYIARGSENKIYVHNKLTLVQVQELTGADGGLQPFAFNNPRELQIIGSTLFMLHDFGATTELRRCSIVEADGTLQFTTGVANPKVLVSPLKFAVNNAFTEYIVLHGGAMQQAKGYVAATGVNSWTIGALGGNKTDVNITDDSFLFDDGITMTSKPFVTYQPNNSHFWIGDPGNSRVKEYDSARTFIRQINCVPTFYSTVVNRTKPTQIGFDSLLYNVSYPAMTFTLSKNYRAGIPLPYAIENPYNMLDNLITFQVGQNYNGIPGNGKTYATIENRNDESAKYPELVEVPDNAAIVFSGTSFGVNAKVYIDSEGTRWEMISNGLSVGDPQPTLQKRTLSALGVWPTWNAPVTVVTFPAITVNSPNHLGFTRPCISQDRVVWCNPEKLHFGKHLGIMEIGGLEWLAQVWPSTFRDEELEGYLNLSYTGPYPPRAFDVGSKVNYAGGSVAAIGKHILTNHKGEGYKEGQDNNWHHWLNNGLQVGQDGIVSGDGIALEREAWLKGAGNASSIEAVQVGDDIIVYMNDESVQSGIPYLKIGNLASIVEETIAINPPTIEVLPGVDLMAGLPFRGVLANGLGWTRSNAEDNTSGSDFWQAKTSIKSYLSTQIDLFMTMKKAGVNRSITRDIAPTAGLVSWKITGELNFEANEAFPEDDDKGAYFDVLDDTGKIICQITHRINYGAFHADGPIKKVKFNTAYAVTLRSRYLDIITNKNQPIEITGSATGVGFTYGGYPALVNQAVFEVGANALKPSKLRFNFLGDAGGDYQRTIDVNSLRYIETLP